MNPRILKKLSKRVAVHAKAFGYTIDLDGPTGCDHTPKRASRKPSHRERYRNRHGVKVVGDLMTPKLTPWLCWTDWGPDGGEGDGEIAWTLLKGRVLQQIDSDARDWDVHLSEDGCGWPPYKKGKPPKLPRNTWELLRLIDHLALVEVEGKAIRAMEWAKREHPIVSSGVINFIG